MHLGAPGACRKQNLSLQNSQAEKQNSRNELSTSWITQMLMCAFGLRSLNCSVDADGLLDLAHRHLINIYSIFGVCSFEEKNSLHGRCFILLVDRHDWRDGCELSQ